MSRKLKNKFLPPNHPWRIDRIKAENELMKKYGLRRKVEIWRMNYVLNKFKSQAKSLVARKDDYAKLQSKNLFDRLKRLNIVKGDVSYDDVLALRLEDVLERRLQTLVVRSGLARTFKQARQMIVHGHIEVNGRVITSPSYLVRASEEASIAFAKGSPFSNPDHPELNINQGKEVVEESNDEANSEDSKEEAKKESKRDNKPGKSNKKENKKKVVKEVA